MNTRSLGLLAFSMWQNAENDGFFEEKCSLMGLY